MTGSNAVAQFDDEFNVMFRANRPDVVSEIKSLVDGPLYLTIELALRHYARDLRARPTGDVEMVPASDLG